MTTASPVQTSALSPTAPAPILALMRNVQVGTINPAVNQVMIGTAPIKPVPPSAQALINTPVPEPVTPAVQVRPAVENTKAANVLPDIFGVEVGA